MVSIPAPRPVGEDEEITLTGCLMPWSDTTNQPVFCRIAGTTKTCIPVFSTKEMLEDWSRVFGFSYDRIKHIDDGVDFLDSIPVEIDVILNPRQHDTLKVRYNLIKR